MLLFTCREVRGCAMPDDDRFRSGLPWRWRRLRRSLAGGDSLDRQAELVVSAVAAELRRSGGFGDLGEIAGVAESRVHEASAAIVESEDMSRRRQLTLAFATVASDQLALTSPLEATENLVRRAVADVVWDRIDRMVTELVGPGKYTAPELIERVEGVLGHDQVTKLVMRVVKNPDTQKLRAPKRISKPASPPDLLHADLGDL
jgi:hypothetical protein